MFGYSLLRAGQAPTRQRSESSPGSTQAATANSVEGSLVFGKETVKLSHAYARLMKNVDKKHARDVLILFMDGPIPEEFVDDYSDARGDGGLNKLYIKSQKGLIRGLQVLINAETHFNAFTIYRSVPFMSHGAEFHFATFTRGLVQGSLSKKDKVFDDAYEFNVTFKVALRADGWTGNFVTGTPTKLKSGKASRQLVIGGQATQPAPVYARLEHNHFDDNGSIIEPIAIPLPMSPCPTTGNGWSFSQMSRAVISGLFRCLLA